MKSKVIKCEEVKYAEFPDLLTGTDEGGNRYADISRFIEKKGKAGEHNEKMFQMHFFFWINAFCKADWPAWGDALLKIWQRPQKPSLASCMRELADCFPDKKNLPSYSAAQRFLRKLPPQVLNKGRMGSRELKKFKAYISRDTSNL